MRAYDRRPAEARKIPAHHDKTFIHWILYLILVAFALSLLN